MGRLLCVMKITKELQKSRKKYVRVSKAVAKEIRTRYKSYSAASQELQIPISSVRRILEGKRVNMEKDRYRLIRENLKGTQRFSLENRFVILARTPANFGDYATRVNLTAKVLDILEPYVYTKNGESEFFKSDPLWSSLLDFVVAAKNVRETLNFLHSRFPQYDDLFFGGTRFAERYDAYVTRHYKPKDPPQKRIQSENIDSKQEEVCTMQIKLRDGTVAPFDRNRITVAIKKALAACDMVSDMVALRVTEDVVSECRNQEVVDQEEIQDRVEEALMKRGLFKVARAYIVYRRDHSIFRGDAIGFFNGFLEKLSAINVDNQNANVDGHSFGGRMGEAASYVCKQAALDFKMSDTARDNHVNNIIYVHDLDHMYVGDHNCLSMPLDSLLANGFTTRQTDIRGAQSVGTAMQLVAVLFQLQSLQQFGGVAATHLDYTMVPFVRKSFKKQCLRVAFREFVYGYGEEMNATLTPELLAYVNKYPIVDEWFSLDKETIKDIEKAFAPWYMGYLKMTDEDFTFSSEKLPRRVRNEALYYTAEETRQAVEALMHNLNSLQSRSGCQLPFTSVNFGTCTEPEGRLVSELVLKAYIKGTGPHGSTPIFPCGIFVLKKGVNEAPGDPNYDLFQLALKSTALRLYPNYANGDWSAQVSWFKMDREMKRRVLDEVSEGDKELLLQALESKPELLKKLTLEIKDNNLEVSEVEQPTEQMSTMGCRTMNGFDLWAEDSYRKAIHDVIATGDTTVDILSAVQKDGRGNICPVTIILPEVAMLAERDIDKFMSLLTLKIEEAKDMLLERFNWIASQPKESAKFMYGNHTMGGYIPGEGIISALRHGTIVIGQLGLAETLQLLIGKDHTTEEGMQLAKRIEQLFKDKIAEFRKQYKMNFGVYYTPAENLCYTALTKFRKKHGIIPNVSDKSFFTNSMHVPVWRRMNPFEKIDIESQLTSYSSAGCITYTELDVSVKNNLEALEQLVLYAMQKDIPYFAVNVPNDHCRDCGYIGEIPAECPKCGSQQVTRLRRVTGYLSQDYHNFNAGKVDEVEHRVKHIG